MEFEEIKKQINNWVDTRMNNPYFGSVIAVWIITDRVLIFGLFNFDSKFTLDQRISFVHRQLESYSFWWLHGFSATILCAFVWGFLTMLVIDQINTFGKALFKIGHKTKNWVLQLIENEKWIDRDDYDKTKKQAIDFEEDLNKKRIELGEAQKNYDVTNRQNIGLIKQNEEKDIIIIQNNEKIKLQENQINDLTKEKNNFRIIYAKYGKGDVWMDVTKTVSDAIMNKGSFTVNNATFKNDPLHFVIKELLIVYENQSVVRTLHAKEGNNVLLELDKLIEVIPDSYKPTTEKDSNQNKLSDIFRGEWLLTFKKDNESDSERVIISEANRYFVNNAHKFNLADIYIDTNNQKITLSKMYLNGKLYAKENLTIDNEKLITGNDSKGFELVYRKLE